MNNQDLRTALRGIMAATPTPRSMNAFTVLEAARRAKRRRRATLAGLASAAAVAVLATAAIAIPSLNRTSGGPIQIGTAPTSTSTPNTETSWPDGQTDRTARQGPQADKAVRLMESLTASVPAGLTSPPDLKPAAGVEWSGGLRMHQAQFADRIDGKDIWEYLVTIPVGGNGKWGKLLAQVVSLGNQLPADDPCALSRQLWGMSGNCVPVSVGDKQVGVVTGTGDRTQLDMWAGYRHPDGTVVFVGQAKTYFMTGLPGLAEEPFTSQQLAALAVDPKFRLG